MELLEWTCIDCGRRIVATDTRRESFFNAIGKHVYDHEGSLTEIPDEPEGLTEDDQTFLKALKIAPYKTAEGPRKPTGR